MNVLESFVTGALIGVAVVLVSLVWAAVGWRLKIEDKEPKDRPRGGDDYFFWTWLFVALLMGSVTATSCIATAPVSISWRSNSSQQYATTEGKTNNKADSAAVNADKTTEATVDLKNGQGQQQQQQQ